jgi:hypothetical protein
MYLVNMPCPVKLTNTYFVNRLCPVKLANMYFVKLAYMCLGNLGIRRVQLSKNWAVMMAYLPQWQNICPVKLLYLSCKVDSLLSYTNSCYLFSLTLLIFVLKCWLILR